MLASQIPGRIPLPWANSGTKNTIPTASQIGIVAGAASFTDGFPPVTFTPKAAGGVAPAGADFNGILYDITAVQQWQSAGGSFKYDATFSTAIGGYPKGAILISADGSTEWLCLVDSNTTDPDSSAAANWAPLEAYGIGTVSGLTNASVTLSASQYGKACVVLSGTLTSNVQITFPKLIGQWNVINATSGAFTASALTSGGTPVICGQGASTILRGDGANVLNDAFNVAEPASTDNSAKSVNSRWAKLGLSFVISFNGYIQFPAWLGGWMIAWGGGTLSDGTGTSLATFATPFPNSIYQVASFYSGAGAAPAATPTIINAGAITLSNVKLYCYSGLTASANITPAYIAIGK